MPVSMIRRAAILAAGSALLVTAADAQDPAVVNPASVHVTREGITYRCTVNMQMGALKTMTGEAKDKDLYTAFRAALQKTAKQLRRMKRELREDKGERTDKDRLLREGARSPGRDRDDAGLPMNDEGDYRAAAE